jgi:hypothetical protein
MEGIGIPLHKGIAIPIRIAIPWNRLLPNKRMTIPLE